ncbi:hypothetical protein AB0D24_38705 [Streptomyces javensis]|uniref:hypothetical protein n=1 Tax=Streptomyces javensis TaxID=114698 RepID=UPI0033EA08B5
MLALGEAGERVSRAGRRPRSWAGGGDGDTDPGAEPGLEYPVYDDVAYEVMIKDERRMNRYTEAVRRYAPGRTVLDIGTRPEGADAAELLKAPSPSRCHLLGVKDVLTPQVG